MMPIRPLRRKSTGVSIAPGSGRRARRHLFYGACLGLACAVGFSFSAAAGGQGKDSFHKKANQEIQGAGTDAVVAGTLITAAEQAIILGYIQQYRGSPSYGFAGAEPLPEGIAKKVARGGAMPPGIAKRYLPADLAMRLPPRPGQQWLAVGTDILLIDATTQVVLDVLHQVL